MVDCQRRWNYTVPTTYQHKRSVEFEYSLWRVLATFFVLGSSLRRCSLRGTFALPTPAEAEAFIAVHDFSFEGPVWVSADEFDSLVVAMPALRSLAVICLRFELRTSETSRSHDDNTTRKAYASLHQMYVGTWRNYNDEEMVHHAWISGASDVVASVRSFAHSRCIVPQDDSKFIRLTCSTGGIALHPVRTTSSESSAGRIRYCGESVVVSSRLLQMFIHSPTVDLTHLTTMSLHEHAFLKLCSLKEDCCRPGVDLAALPVVTFPNVTRLTIWLASCWEHHQLGTWHRYGDPEAFLGLLCSDVWMTPALPRLSILCLTRGTIPKLESRSGRPVTHCSPIFLADEVEPRYLCCCGRRPVISLRDLYSFMQILGRQVNSMADQLDLQICALDCVDVNLSGTLASLQGLVKSVDFVEESVRSEVSPVRSEIVHEAPAIFDLLGSS